MTIHVCSKHSYVGSEKCPGCLTPDEWNKRNRDNLEWLVFLCLMQENPPISIGRGKELLGFQYMDDMREWLDKKHKEKDG